ALERSQGASPSCRRVAATRASYEPPTRRVVVDSSSVRLGFHTFGSCVQFRERATRLGDQLRRAGAGRQELADDLPGLRCLPASGGATVLARETSPRCGGRPARPPGGNSRPPRRTAPG